MKTPTDVTDLTPEWFSHVLEADISGVEILDAHTGTTGRARVRLTTQASLPETLFVKLQPFLPEQREFVRMVGMGVAEARVLRLGRCRAARPHPPRVAFVVRRG